MTLKRSLANTALAALAFAVALCASEAVVRLLYKDETVLFPRYHTDYRYERYVIRGIRPNVRFQHTSVDGSWTFITNSRGFRNTKEFAYDKPAGTLRILSLGDSQTQGYEVAQDATFSAVAERYIESREAKAEVINAGVSGFSTAEALVFLENEGVKYRPDVVVLGFYANDFDDNLKADLFTLDEQGALVENKHEHIPGVRIQNAMYGIPGVAWLSENSYLYSMLFNSVWAAAKTRLAVQAREHAAARIGASPGDGLEYAVPASGALSAHQVAVTAALLVRMRRFCTDKGIRFIVADIPARRGPFRIESSVPPALRSRLAAAGVELIASESLFQPFDGVVQMHVGHGHQHISEFTHALIGAELGRRALEPLRAPTPAQPPP